MTAAKRTIKRKPVVETVRPKPTTKPMIKAKPKPKVVVYIAVGAEQVHPFQGIRIPVQPPGVQLSKDSWLESQLKAGIVKEI